MAPNTTVEDFDLFISNYAVNELSLDLRLDYVRGLMRHARYGCMHTARLCRRACTLTRSLKHARANECAHTQAHTCTRAKVYDMGCV